MRRCFPLHHTRSVVSLDGRWTYLFPVEGTELSPAPALTTDLRSSLPAEVMAEEVAVPGVWEMLASRRTYRGQAIARRAVTVPQTGPMRLVFEGVSHTARVFWDGEEVGFHHNAFTAFTIDLPEVAAGEHVLALHISNEHGEISALHIPNDYYNYGGISRPVEVQFPRRSLYLDRIEVTPSQTDNGKWQANVAIEVVNLADNPVEAVLALDLGEFSESRSFAPGRTRVEARIDCPEALPWTPAAPNLTMLRATLADASGEVFDDLQERVGFRTVALRGEEILLNGEPVYIQGFNRHEDHPEYGCALPLSHFMKDLEIMHDLGANAVRTSHYPNDPRFLDLCDERGFLVWEENHARGFMLDSQMNHPRFREQCREVNREMVTQHFNHPSIILWGILNECSSHNLPGRAKYAEQFAQIRELDPSRPVTYASCRHGDDICQDLPDVAGWNLYPNWYGFESPLSALERLRNDMEPRGMAGKPLILSEFGGGAIPGFRDPVRRAKWSEDRQEDILIELLESFLPYERVCGVFLWQFCDVRVDESWFASRPRCMNNKGIVDEFRRPKLAYPAVAERLQGNRRVQPAHRSRG